MNEFAFEALEAYYDGIGNEETPSSVGSFARKADAEPWLKPGAFGSMAGGFAFALVFLTCLVSVPASASSTVPYLEAQARRSGIQLDAFVPETRYRSQSARRPWTV